MCTLDQISSAVTFSVKMVSLNMYHWVGWKPYIKGTKGINRLKKFCGSWLYPSTCSFVFLLYLSMVNLLQRSIYLRSYLFRDVLQVAFLASEVGPRVAAACASAALSVLTRDDSR